MRRSLKPLAYILALLSAALGSTFFFRVKQPAQVVLSFFKLLTGSLSAFVAAIGAMGAALGLLVKAPWAALAGVAGALLSARYIQQATAPHDGFERAFGVGWQRRIAPERRKHMLKQRWTWKLPASPEPSWQRDVPFSTVPGTERQLLCDLWQPPEGIVPSGLAVIYYHGSGWHFLDKDFGTRPLFCHLAAQGHVVMDVAYRLCPETDLYGMIGDVKRAIAWMKANAGRYGVGADRIVLAGASAGGHLALLAAYAPHHPALTPKEIRGIDLSVRAVVSWYGPTDLNVYHEYAGAKIVGTEPAEQKAGFLGGLADRLFQALVAPERLEGQDFAVGTDEMMINLLGGLPDEVPAVYKLASPIHHVKPDCPPTLLFQGEHDFLVSAEAVRDMVDKLVQAGVPVVYVEFPLTDHAFDVALWPEFSPPAQAAVYDLDRFLALMV